MQEGDDKNKKKLVTPRASEKSKALFRAIIQNPETQPKTTEEQIDHIRKHGVDAHYDFIRKGALFALQPEKRRHTSENIVVTGCVPPFTMPLQLHAYFHLLNRLGIDYSYFKDREYCCAWAAVEQAIIDAKGDVTPRHGKAMDASREFMSMNCAKAREMGGKRMYYFCVWCSHLALWHFDENKEIEHLYHLDLVVDRLEKEKLRLPEPKVVAYYEGCHLRNEGVLHGPKLNWAAYRHLMHRVENVELVPMPDKLCCVVNPEAVVEAAVKQKADMIVTSCTACDTWVGRSARGKITEKFMVEFLLDALGPK